MKTAQFNRSYIWYVILITYHNVQVGKYITEDIISNAYKQRLFLILRILFKVTNDFH